jgi:hypothetical protein
MPAQEDLKKEVQENIKHINGASHAPASSTISTSNIAGKGGHALLTPPQSDSPGRDNVTAQGGLKVQENVKGLNDANDALAPNTINAWSGPGPAAFDFRSTSFSLSQPFVCLKMTLY